MRHVNYEIAARIELEPDARAARGDRCVSSRRELLAGQEAWVVGGAVRDELLGREVVDLDIACPRAGGSRAGAMRPRAGGAPFPLSERHGAWRVALADGQHRRLHAVRRDDRGGSGDAGLHDQRDRACRSAGGERGRSVRGARRSRREARSAPSRRACSRDDPLRLLRAVRLEDELGFRLEAETERLVRAHAALVTEPAGERNAGRARAALGRRLPPRGRARAAGAARGLERRPRPAARWSTRPRSASVAVFGDALRRFRFRTRRSATRRRFSARRPPEDGSPRSIHRFRRATEPWALDALAFVGAPELEDEVLAAREREPVEPLLRGDELGVPPRPRDRPAARADRRGARCRDDLDARGGARARQARTRAVEVALSARFRDRRVRPIPNRIAAGRRWAVPKRRGLA